MTSMLGMAGRCATLVTRSPHDLSFRSDEKSNSYRKVADFVPGALGKSSSGFAREPGLPHNTAP
jgi:hypothetical protein